MPIQHLLLTRPCQLDFLCCKWGHASLTGLPTKHVWSRSQLRQRFVIRFSALRAQQTHESNGRVQWRAVCFRHRNLAILFCHCYAGSTQEKRRGQHSKISCQTWIRGKRIWHCYICLSLWDNYTWGWRKSMPSTKICTCCAQVPSARLLSLCYSVAWSCPSIYNLQSISHSYSLWNASLKL
jgi:hypothetical protein